jgi:3-deoxy-D-manno-octulosonic-acid transferase
MSIIFDAAYLAALVCGSPYFLLKLATNGRYRSGLAQRLGWLNIKHEERPSIWIHGASVGEILTVKALVKSLEKEFNKTDIVLSANTNTGLAVAEKCYRDKNVFYFPLDLSWVVDKVLRTINPVCIILVELEVWPNFLIEAAKKHIPVVLLNARISEKSLRWYHVLGKISPVFLESITRKENVFCARTDVDGARLKHLGISEAQINVTGNMKYDNIITSVPEDVQKRLHRLFEIGDNDKVIVCGSTHEGEETIILKVFKQLQEKFNKLRLILAPRHIERVSDVIKHVESAGLRWVRRTSLGKGNTIGGQKYETVILLDTVGELLHVYSVADCVFVGKSLVPQGGQNMMEPAGMAKPIIVGPHTFNFQEEMRLLYTAGAIKIVQNEQSFFSEIVALFERPDAAREMGKKAQAVVVKHQGATERNVDVLRKILFKERAVFV